VCPLKKIRGGGGLRENEGQETTFLHSVLKSFLKQHSTLDFEILSQFLGKEV
jgi:hypothetical protein